MKSKADISMIDQNYHTRVPDSVIEFLKLKTGDHILWKIDLKSKTITVTKVD